MTGIPAGFAAGYIAVEAAGSGEDITYWVLDQTQMDEVELEYKTSNDYAEAMGEIVDRYGLVAAGAGCSTIKEAIEFMLARKMILVEDFNYISY